jgi:hypothetical protein
VPRQPHARLVHINVRELLEESVECGKQQQSSDEMLWSVGTNRTRTCVKLFCLNGTSMFVII